MKSKAGRVGLNINGLDAMFAGLKEIAKEEKKRLRRRYISDHEPILQYSRKGWGKRKNRPPPPKEYLKIIEDQAFCHRFDWLVLRPHLRPRLSCQ